MRSRTASLCGTTGLVTALLAMPAAGAAEPAAGSAARGPVLAAEATETCALGAEPVEAGNERAMAEAPEPEIDCFPTFAEAIEFVTDGRISAESPAELERLAAEPETAAVLASSVMLGIEYQGSNYSGSNLVLYGSSGSGCGSSATYGYPTMPSGWSNVISSARSYAGCRSTHYDYTYYSGASRTCWGSCQYMGDLNNRTSSIVFRP